MQKRRIFYAVLTIAVIAAAIGFWGLRGDGDMAAIEPAAGPGGPGGAQHGMPVEAQAVTVDAIERTVEAVGTLQSNEAVIIRPEIAGIITEILFEEGSEVEEGAPLIRLDDSVFKAELAEAQASLVLAKANYERAQDLFQKQTGTRRALDEARAAFEESQARLDLARARLAKTEIRAPFAGIIGLRRVSMGDYVTPGQDLVNLEDITPLKADFRVAETYLPLVREGQAIRVRVDALPGETFDGMVYAINPRIDESGRSIVIRAYVPNENKVLKPGLFARVFLVVDRRENTVLVPEEALMPQQGSQSVYKVVDGKAEMTPVQTGLRRQGMVEITEGLQAGDMVITAGQMKVQPGAPVTVMPPQDAGPAAEGPGKTKGGR